MWKSLALLPVLLAPSLAQILQFGSGQLPLCAQTCTQLANAQAPCLTSPSSEQTCFCSSTVLTQANLAQSTDNICTSTCPAASDRQQIQGWFNNYCKNAQANPAAGATSSTPNSPTSTSDSAAAASTSGYAGTPVNQNTDWWSAHAKWIAMVIVLVVAFIIIIIVGIWLKRRHDRKVNRATTTPLPVGWGPNSDPHHYQGPTEKNSASRAHEAPPASVSVMEEGRSRSHRLSKKGKK